MRLLIRNGHVIDPANKIDAPLDIFVEGSRIGKVAPDIAWEADTVIDAAGKMVIPGLVDMHVHLREPGREDKETIETGSRAALKGGVVSVLVMPNTTPVPDSPEHVRLLSSHISKSAAVNIFMAGAMTKERLGREVAPLSHLKKEGVIAVTDDGASVEDEAVMLEVLTQAKKAGILALCHCEDKVISGKGVVNRGFIATCMGLRGMAKEAEYKRVERDVGLAQKADAKVHITHLSCKESVEIIAQAKKKGVRVTADVTPHHLAFNEEAVLGYDTNFKMNPPLRSTIDREALRQGLKDGTIDCIASDHAPHTENEKDIEFDRAEFGVIGLETELAVAISELVETGLLGWGGLVEKMSLNPARILEIDKGTLGEGKDADIAIISPQAAWEVTKDGFVSKSKNSPFIGKRLKGVVTHTIWGGKLVYCNSRIQ